MHSITVALLAYKEAENLKILLPKIKKNLDSLAVDYEIEVIDTAEPLDNTAAVCKEFGATYRNQEYPGFGGALKTAIKYANNELFLILDSDGSHNPDYIPSMYQKYVLENCDLVIGSRYVSGGKTYDSKSSVIMSRLLNFAFRLFLGIKAKDISTDFRLYDTEQLKQITLENVNYDILQEIILKLKLNKRDLKIGEVPIAFEKRIYGESKRKLIPFIISYIKSLFRLTALRFQWIKTFVLYGLIGIAGAAIDYSVFGLFTLNGVIPDVANVAGGIGGFLFTFTINSVFNFKKTTHIVKRFISYGLICAVGMLISTICMSILKSYCNIYILKIGLICGISLLQFVLNKKITYRT